MCGFTSSYTQTEHTIGTGPFTYVEMLKMVISVTTICVVAKLDG